MNCVNEKDLDGANVINFIMGRIFQDFGIDYKDREGCESIFNRFSKDMF